jgi:hypothetical protein
MKKILLLCTFICASLISLTQPTNTKGANNPNISSFQFVIIMGFVVMLTVYFLLHIDKEDKEEKAIVKDPDAPAFIEEYLRNEGMKLLGCIVKGELSAYQYALVKNPEGLAQVLKRIKREQFFRALILINGQGEWYLFVSKQTGDTIILSKKEIGYKFIPNKIQHFKLEEANLAYLEGASAAK